MRASPQIDITPQDAARELLARRKARRSLLDFTRYTMPGYEVNWHHEVLCEALDRFVDGDITRLIVAMPPRHGKSELVSRRLPAYILGRNPDAAVMGCSYSATLASQLNRDVQRVITSHAYRNLFPSTELYGKNIRSVADGSWLRNSDVFEVVGHRGVYRSAGVGGSITGMGFDYGIIDDPIKDRRDANSKTIRERVWEWYTSTFYTRQSAQGRILVTATRWHKDDLTGRLLDRMRGPDGEDWHIVTFPARAEGNLAGNDPRQPGEALWPSRFSAAFLDKVEANNIVDWAALYQQQPIALGNELFDVAQIEIVDVSPPVVRKVRFYDLAVTAKASSDYTAGLLLGITEDERPAVLDIVRLQAEMPRVQDVIAQTAAMDGPDVPIVLEGEKAGIIQLDYLLRDPRMHPYNIQIIAPVGDKYTRAAPIATRINNGRALMVRGNWNHAFIDELATFPQGRHDDMVDALSGAWNALEDGQVSWFVM